MKSYKFTCSYILISLITTFFVTGRIYVLIVTPLVTLWVGKYFVSHFTILFTCSELFVFTKIPFVPHRHGVFAWNV